MAPISKISLSRRAFRTIRITDFVLREGVLAGATLIELTVTARQALTIHRISRIGRSRIGCNLAGVLFIGFRAMLMSSLLVVGLCVGDTCNGKERSCEHDVFHGVYFQLERQLAYVWRKLAILEGRWMKTTGYGCVETTALRHGCVFGNVKLGARRLIKNRVEAQTDSVIGAENTALT